jgi:hypothetical protein
MPTAETLERFIARVEQNAHAEAIEEFYTVDATMQENQSPPRLGRDAPVANERRVFARARTVRSQCVRPVFVSGDRVVIRWMFDFEWLDGAATPRVRADRPIHSSCKATMLRCSRRCPNLEDGR